MAYGFGGGSRAAGGAADRGSVSGYSGSSGKSSTSSSKSSAGGGGTSSGSYSAASKSASKSTSSASKSSGSSGTAAARSADRSSVSGYSGANRAGATSTASNASRAAGAAADRASVSGYTGKTTSAASRAPSTGYQPDLSTRHRMGAESWAGMEVAPGDLTGRTRMGGVTYGANKAPTSPTGFKPDLGVRSALNAADAVAPAAATRQVNERRAGLATAARAAEETSMKSLYNSLSPNEKFLSDTYSYAKQAGLNDTQARLAAAQAALETGYGKHLVGNNYFGMKAGKSWTGDTVNAYTKEEVGGKLAGQRDVFRSYATPADSFKDWQGMVSKNWPGAMSANTFEGAVAGLRATQKGGYATDSKYNSKLRSKDDEGSIGRAAAGYGDTSLWGGRPNKEAPAVAATQPRAANEAASAREAGMIAHDNAVSEAVKQGQNANDPGVQSLANLAKQEAERTWNPNTATAAAQPAPPSTPDASVYGNKPEGKQPGQTYPSGPRSLVEQGVATGIDVLGGLVPGVGMGITGFNVISKLMGGPTIGEGITDIYAGRLENKYEPGSTPERPGGGPTLGESGQSSRIQSPQSQLVTPSTGATAGTGTAAATSSFESKYLEDTGRPTPEQKWDWTSSKYIGVANAPSV